jgi:hypothetical protein
MTTRRALIDLIEEMGIDDSLDIVFLREGEEIELELECGSYYAKGPGALFIGFLPKEAYE